MKEQKKISHKGHTVVSHIYLALSVNEIDRLVSVHMAKFAQVAHNGLPD